MSRDDISVEFMLRDVPPVYERLWATFDRDSFFRSPAHLRFVADVTGAQLGFAVGCMAGTAKAALPFALKDGAYGAILNALPFYGSCSGIVGDATTELRAAMVQATHDFATSSGVAAATFVDDWRLKSFDHLDGAAFVTERTNQFIELGKFNANDVAGHYHQKTRNLVRKAEKLGVAVRRSTLAADIDGLERAHVENMAAVNGLAKPAVFFDHLKRPDTQFGPMTLYVASHQGRDCAYLLNFYCGDMVEYYMPAVFVADRSLQPLSLLIHTAITDAIRDGFSYWNFGGTWLTQESLRHFKIRWGSSETTYRYFTYIYDQRILDVDRARISKAYTYFFVAPFDKFPTVPLDRAAS